MRFRDKWNSLIRSSGQRQTESRYLETVCAFDLKDLKCFDAEIFVVVAMVVVLDLVSSTAQGTVRKCFRKDLYLIRCLVMRISCVSEEEGLSVIYNRPLEIMISSIEAAHMQWRMMLQSSRSISQGGTDISGLLVDCGISLLHLLTSPPKQAKWTWKLEDLFWGRKVHAGC